MNEQIRANLLLLCRTKTNRCSRFENAEIRGSNSEKKQNTVRTIVT